MGLSLIALLMTGTLVREISAQQSGMNWNVFYQPLSFLIFLICAFAETNRTPFDLAECETELMVDTIQNTLYENGFLAEYVCFSSIAGGI
jgi:NADH:ubiquinone oxidoreductase subunit H